MTDAARFLRQTLLPEIGAGGQRRICDGAAHVAGASLAHEVAMLYARGAGFGRVVEGAIDLDALAPPSLRLTEEARAVLAGSRAALAAIRLAALGDPR